MTNWVESQNVEGLTMEVKQVEGRTPLIFIEVQATDPDAGTVLMFVMRACLEHTTLPLHASTNREFSVRSKRCVNLGSHCVLHIIY